MRKWTIGEIGKTNPIQTQTNPIYDESGCQQACEKTPKSEI